MSVLNHKHKFIFMHEPHCGGRSYERVLMAYEGSHNFNGEHHIPISKMIDREWVTADQFDEYYKFRFIRNPYDWLVTCWLSAAYRHTSLNDWVFEGGLKYIKSDTLFWRYHGVVNNTLFLDKEGLEVLNVLFKNRGIPTIKSLPRVGESKDKPNWRLRFTIKEAIEIEKVYKDIARYNYKVIRDDE